jgi:hypothetical protein
MVATSCFAVSIVASGTGGAALARRAFPIKAAAPATIRIPPAMIAAAIHAFIAVESSKIPPAVSAPRP